MVNHEEDASYHVHSKNHSTFTTAPQSKPTIHHEVVPFSTLLIIVIPIIIVILLIAIFLLALVLRRLRLLPNREGNSTNKNAEGSVKKGVIDSGDCMFVAHRTINISTSPGGADGGCLYGTSLVSTPQCKEVVRGNQLVQVYTLREIETATNRFSEANIIGIGISGVVYKGLLRDGTVAAVKTMRTHGRHGERAFRVEVDLLSRLRSPYICELLGYCADQQHRSLVFEYMPNASLQTHLHQRRSLNWAIRLKVALECARALEYLHEHTSPSVIHRNLNCNNVLLDRAFKAKLSGFGLAKVGSNKLNGLIATRVLGTTGYLAPEYASTGKLTTKSDTYSYGIILLELLTGRQPIDTTRPPGEHVLVSWALPRLTKTEKLMEMIDPVIKGQFSLKDIIQVAAIAAMCVQTEADYRPLMTDVVQSLMPLVKNNQYNNINSTIVSPTPSSHRILK